MANQTVADTVKPVLGNVANQAISKIGSFVGLVGGGFARDWRLQRNYLFEALLPDISGINGAEVSKYCQDISFGDYNMGDLASMKYGAYRSKYAGSLEVASCVMRFLKPSPDIVSTYFYEWRKLIVSDDGHYYPKNKYASKIYVVLYDTTGTENGKFKLLGAFPKTFPAYALSYKEEKITEFEIEFSIDRVVLE